MTQFLSKFALIAIVACLVHPTYTSAQTVETPSEVVVKSPDHTSQITAMLEKYREYGQLNAAVLVCEKGEPILREGYGLANFEWDIPIKPTTKFRIGSVTKQFTAALVLQLVEDGKVELDEPITTYLPKYRKDTGDKVTVHHLLNHTSGIPSYTTPDFFAKHSRDSYELDEFVEQFASGEFQFDPGTQFAYNNSGYHLLGAIIEKVSGKSYADQLQERILDPLSMTDSGYDVSATILKNRAQGYEKTATGFKNADYLDMGIPYSAGSMYSTIDDLLKWDRALRSNSVLTKASKELMFKPGMGNYGYGFFIEQRELGSTNETTRVVQHGGGINGFNCLFTRVVDQNHLIVILDNVGMGNHHGDITSAIINILNDEPYDRPKKSIADALARVAMKSGGAAAVSKYRDLKTDSPNVYDFDNEEALNQLGYRLLGDKKIKDAIEVLKLNVEMFPDSFNPYDSLGEAYLADDQTDLALANYKQSVKLNPENEGGKLAISKLEGNEAKVDIAKLKLCVGKYELRPGFVVTITLEDGILMGQPTGQEKVELQTLSETTFIVPSVKANVKFTKDENGAVTGMILTQGDNELVGEKLE